MKWETVLTVPSRQLMLQPSWWQALPVASPQGSNQIALVLHLESGWDVYWVNAGDSGEAPSVDWVLPAGVTVGKMQFPTPSGYRSGR